MNRYVKLTGLAVALVAAFLLGAVALNTASAQTYAPPTLVTPTPVPTPWVPPTPSWMDGSAGDEEASEVESITCSITDGCEVDVTFVTDEGEVAKRMIITLVDPEPEATAETE